MTQKKEFVYVRPKYVIELYRSGMTQLEILIDAVMKYENNIVLRKSYGCIRDKKFYKKAIHNILVSAMKSGQIDNYEIRTRKSRR